MSPGVVLATNGYTGNLWPRLRQSMIAANSFMIATKPLPEAVGGSILANGVGCNGRGIALSTMMGAQLANRLLGAPASGFPFPVTSVRPISFHGLQRFYIAAGIACYRVLDKFS